jgi:hypothetical protein
MPSRARRKLPGKRRAVASTRRLTSKRRAKSASGTAGRRRQALRQASRGHLKRQAAEEQRALGNLFHEQVEPLWSRFGNGCRQFADGFNAEWGCVKLQIEFGSDAVMAKFAGGEVLVQLVRENQHVFCVMTSGCTDMGACCVDQLPLGLSIADGRLGFMYGADAMSEDSLAVKLLTDLVQMNTPGTAAAPDTPPSP